MNRARLFFPYVLLVAIGGVVVITNVPKGSATDPSVESRAIVCAPCGMEIERADALARVVEGATHYFCSPGCADRFTGDATTASASGRVLIDRVCHMEVNSAWGIQAEYEGKTYHFCTKRCRRRFLDAPAGFLESKCLVCGLGMEDGPTYPATYLGKTYELCSQAHRAEFKEDPAAFFMHTMWGIPTWLYYGSIALVLIVSFGVFDLLSRRSVKAVDRQTSGRHSRRVINRDEIRGAGERLFGGGQVGYGGATSVALPIVSAGALESSRAVGEDCTVRSDRFDLLSLGFIRSAVRSRVFRFVCQMFFSVSFLVIIAAGLFGNQNPALNIAPILTWTVWWGMLIILIMFAGKAWCYVCPWDAIAGWTEKLAFWRKTDDGLGLGLKWPRIIRNISIATILFVGLTWIELGFGVTMKPRVTAYLAIAMLLMAVVSAMLFDRKSFCRYGCLVGRVSGLYALFAGVEVRNKDDDVCSTCRTKECVKGSETAYGCPTFLYPGKISTNTYCIQCMECVQACPHDNLALNVRPWGSDLVTQGRPRADEAYLALLMLAITGFHGVTMTPVWQQLIDAIRGMADVGRVVGFSVGMTMLMLGPIGVYAALVFVSKTLGKGASLQPLTYRDYFIQYAYALLPIALFYHIAHNMEHLLMEGPKVLAMVSDPFGWGWNMFGTANWSIPPLISLEKLWIVQVVLVLIGHVYSLWVAQRTSLRLFGSSKAAFRSQLPMLLGMIAFSVFSLWLLKQPMEMRTSAM
jgi:YHS domain-containing protein